MPRRGSQEAFDGGGKPADNLTNQNFTHLMQVCGEDIDLVIDHLLRIKVIPSYRFLNNQLNEQLLNDLHLNLRPLERVLRSRYTECRCSALQRLTMKSVIVSGSMAEGLNNPKSYPMQHITSDLDTMVELGPVRWTFPDAKETLPEEDTAEGSVAATPTPNPRSRDGDAAPLLVIAETENPGYVLVLQKRKEDCSHQERQPLSAEAVKSFMKDYQIMTMTESATLHRNADGPACSYSLHTDGLFSVPDRDEVPCLHVPVWWFSDEFFTRHRRYNWPPEDVRDNIRQFGLHLVPVGAPGSSTRRIQWRLSFSRAEVVISYQLTETQKCAIIAFKICKKALGKGGKVIKSYFVKTALLWLCEQTSAENWTSIIQGVFNLIDFLDEAVRHGNLPCYFYSSINLLRFKSTRDRKTMERTLGTIRRDMRTLLTHERLADDTHLAAVLNHETKRLSEDQIRVCLARYSIRAGFQLSMTNYAQMTSVDRLNKLLPLVLRSYSSDEVASLLRAWSTWYNMQMGLYEALNVVPKDVIRQIFLLASGDGFVFDAAPLLELLTEDDLKQMLGDPAAVRAWLRRQHQLPETERLHGLPADLESAGDLCDLLLDMFLLPLTLMESVPDTFRHFYCASASLPVLKSHSTAEEEARQVALETSAVWQGLGIRFCIELGIDPQTAKRMACQLGVEMRQLWDDPQTLAEHREIWHSLRDPWQLRQFVFKSD